jgi:hypothetical protein
MIRAFHVEHILILTFLSLVAGFPAAAEPIPGNRVLAQTEPTEAAPEPLLPGIGPGPLEAPPPEDPTGPAAETPADGSALELDIEIGELRAIDPDSGGLLEPSMGGLGIGMWEGVSRRLLLRLLPQLPDRYESPALHDLARRLLLSTAIVPPRTESETGGGVMAARIEKLEAMGLSGAVADMLDLVPEGTRDPTLLRILIDDRLLAGDDDGACAVSATAGDVLTGTYWEKFLVFCQARAGDSAAANFGISLLSEAGNAEDPAYFKMVGALLTGGKPKVRSLPAPTPLHLALARATGTPLPSDVLETKSLAVLRALVGVPATGRPVVAPGGAGRRVGARSRPGGMAGGAAGPCRRHRHGAAGRSLHGHRVFREGNREGADPGGGGPFAAQPGPAVSGGAAPGIAGRPRGRDAEGVAAGQGRRHLPAEHRCIPAHAGRAETGVADLVRRRCRALSVRARPARKEYRQRGDLLWPLVALAEGSARGPGQAEWLAALRARAGADAGLKAGLAYALFEAMGERMREEDWMALLDGVSRAPALAADPAYLRQFRRAASAGRRGETVLLALLILGRGGVADAGPQLVSEIIVGLRMVRLEEEARRLALEAALQGGL